MSLSHCRQCSRIRIGSPVPCRNRGSYIDVLRWRADQLVPQREHYRRPGANRTRTCSLGESCPVRWTTGRGDAPGIRTQHGRVAACLPRQRDTRHGIPGPTRTGDLLLRKQPRFPAAPRGHGVRRGGLEPPCGIPDLRSGAVAAAPPTLGVTGGTRIMWPGHVLQPGRRIPGQCRSRRPSPPLARRRLGGGRSRGSA